MNRRTFIGTTTVAAMLGGISRRTESDELPEPETRDRGTVNKLEEATLRDLQKSMSSGEMSSRSLTEAYLARIEETNRRGPALGAVIETNPDALKIADQLDAERKATGPRGPLHGIPILVKDNIDTLDQMLTTAGSLALAGSKPSQDAFVAAQLRRAGAVILGKTNLPEFAGWRGKLYFAWSARGGFCRNPYALDRSPCGSSSGSAVAVSANLAAAAIGTETDGSIMAPAAINGIVGIKPTVGLVSRAGIVPISHVQDTAGPMARTVTDAAALLTAIVGVDARDPTTMSGRDHAADYMPSLNRNGLRGARIGAAKAFTGSDHRVDSLVDQAIQAMRDQGATIVDIREDAYSPGRLEEVVELEERVLNYQFKDNLNRYLLDRGPQAPVRTLKDVIAFNLRNADRELQYGDQDLLIRSESMGPLSSPDYRATYAKMRKMAQNQGLDDILEKHHLKALVAATIQDLPPLIDLVNGDRWLSSTRCLHSYAAMAGYPSISIPIGFVHGLPVGLSFVGSAWSEATLIRMAFALEQTINTRRPPKLLPTVDMSS